MPLGPYADLYGTVANDKAAYSDLPGTVTGGRGPYDLTGTVSRRQVLAWDSPSLFYRPRVKLGDSFIDPRDLEGGPQVGENDLDSHTASMSFALRGRRWSAGQTEKVFARTPVEIYFDHGREGDVIEPATPDYAGYVIGCQQGSNAREPVVNVSCGDGAALYEKATLCFEIAPGADYTRGEIVELACADLGIPLAAPPPRGAVYRKPLQWTNKSPFEALKPFIEPEGWRIRFNAARQLEIYTPEIKRAPLPPDFRWSTADLLQPPEIEPPSDSPSRWVLTCVTVVDVNEVGQVTETTTATIEGLYAPAVATQQQQTDGSVVATGFPSEPEALRVISQIVDVVVKQAGQPIMQRTTESGWYNLGAARLASNASSSGGGYNFLQVYIDDSGKYVQEWKERFRAIGERLVTFTYNGNGDLTGQRVVTSRWRLTEQGVRAVGTSASATTVLNAYVHGDDQSYLERVEQWGIDEEQRISFTYGSDGPLLYTTQEEWRYFNPRTKIDHGSAHPTYFVLYNGEAHKGQVATWRKTKSVQETNIVSLSDGLKGTQTATSEWNARKRVDGPNDFGTYKSNAEEQAFQLVRVEPKQFRVINDDQYEEITHDADGNRVARIFLGRVPTTRYQSSTWTRLLTQPLEVVIEDPLAEAWFGFQKETLEHEYVQDDVEALRVLHARRRRAMALKVQVTRIDTMAQRGDTVDFTSEEDGISGRFLIVDRIRDWSNILPVVTYVMEQH